jgi:hypothetical protein
MAGKQLQKHLLKNRRNILFKLILRHTQIFLAYSKQIPNNRRFAVVKLLTPLLGGAAAG